MNAIRHMPLGVLAMAIAAAAPPRAWSEEEVVVSKTITSKVVENSTAAELEESITTAIAKEFAKFIDRSEALKNTSNPVPNRATHLPSLQRRFRDIKNRLRQDIENGVDIDEAIARRDNSVRRMWDDFRRRRTHEYRIFRINKSTYKEKHGKLVCQVCARKWRHATATITVPDREHMVISTSPAPVFRRSTHRSPAHADAPAISGDKKSVTCRLNAKDRYNGEGRSVIGGRLYASCQYTSSYITSSVAEDAIWLERRVDP